MSLTAVGRPAGEMLGGRFFVIGYVPVCAAFLFVLLLVWAGAPGTTLEWSEAWRRVDALGAGEALLLVFGTVVAALVLHPFQLPFVRLLEGYWPPWCAGVARWGTSRQKSRMERLERASRDLTDGDPTGPGGPPGGAGPRCAARPLPEAAAPGAPHPAGQRARRRGGPVR